MAGDADYFRERRVVYRRKHRSKQALLNKQRLVLFAIALGAVLVLIGLYKLLHLPGMRVVNFSIQGGEAKTEAEILEFLQRETLGDALRFIPKDNIFLISTRSIEESLLSEFPSLETVSVKKELFHTLFVSLTERTPWAIFCTRNEALAAGIQEAHRSCFYIDRTGILFRKAPVVEGNLILTISSDQPSQDLGDIALDAATIAEFEAIAKALKDRAGLRVSGFELKQNAPKDYWVRVDEGFRVIATRGVSYQTMAEVVRTVLEQEIQGDRKKLDYIDARFGNKVFYKFR